MGLRGLEGPKGEDGAPGPKGEDGRTILSGERNPKPEDGERGDFWINTETYWFFGPKQKDKWPPGVRLVGPTGPESRVYSGGGGSSGIPEAPSDGGEYVRKNGEWVVASAGASNADDITADIAADETLTTVDEALEHVVGETDLVDLTLLLDNALV
jgi:hypothetical protein